MSAEEIEETTTKSVSCCGRESPYDHPKIYLEIDPKLKKIDCPYCGKIFELIN